MKKRMVLAGLLAANLLLARAAGREVGRKAEALPPPGIRHPAT